MSKKLAIKGHPTRGNEVIELLEMMGGYKDSLLKDDDIYDDNYFYFILAEENNAIDGYPLKYKDKVDEDYVIFTLEEFLEKYPFKIHDFVHIPEYESEADICGMRWDPTCQDVEYLVYRCDDEEWYTAKELLEYNDYPNKTRDCKKCGLHFGSVRCFAMDCPHNKPKSYAVGLKDGKVIDCIANKKTDMNKNNREVINMTKETITPPPDITANVIDKNNCDIACPDGYEFYDENGNLIGNKVMMRPKKPKYPTSYSDCCDILGFKNRNKTEQQFLNSCDLYDFELMTKLSMLKVCRVAYWKIAGEELELGKPWEPDWTNLDQLKYCIWVDVGEFITMVNVRGQHILAFPTEEIRDAFYENFKHMIEQCKELL